MIETTHFQEEAQLLINQILQWHRNEGQQAEEEGAEGAHQEQQEEEIVSCDNSPLEQLIT
jgi:hypothetical protein